VELQAGQQADVSVHDEDQNRRSGFHRVRPDHGNRHGGQQSSQIDLKTLKELRVHNYEID
jgi:hypothetical protein